MYIGLMENKELTKTRTIDIGQLESIFIKGDIRSMTEIQRIEYTREVCRSLGLNSMTRPFDFIEFQGGKLQLYANKSCTDQLRAIYGISVKIVSQVIEEGLMTVVAEARFPDGRSDEDIGCLQVGHLRGEALANAKMKCVTKAKRRVTLSICGLGMLDETETETIPGAKKAEFKKEEKEFSQDKVKLIKPVNTEESVPDEELSEDPYRNRLYKDIMAIYKDYLTAFPDTIMKELLKSKYGPEEVRLMSVEQLAHLYKFLTSELNPAQVSHNKPHGPIIVKKPDEPLASEEQIQGMFAQAKAAGVTTVEPLTAYIYSEFGKQKFKALSVSELLILSDAIRDRKIKPSKISAPKIAPIQPREPGEDQDEEISSLESNRIPEDELPWSKEQESFLK